MKMPDDHDIENDAEILHELGNMFLVKVNGETRQVANTPKNELLYKHGLHSLLHSNADTGRTILNEQDPYIAISPTANDSVYSMWVGDPEAYPVQNPPSDANEVLKGVRNAITDPVDYATLLNAYESAREQQVRRELIEELLPLFPRTSVIPEEDGWVVEGMFLVTWDARVFLVTDDLDGTSYTAFGGISETDEKREFLSLTPDTVPDGQTVTIDGTEYELGEMELLFLSKVKWLLKYDEMYEDDAFWSVIERHVLTDGDPTLAQR